MADSISSPSLNPDRITLYHDPDRGHHLLRIEFTLEILVLRRVDGEWLPEEEDTILREESVGLIRCVRVLEPIDTMHKEVMHLLSANVR